MKRRELTVVSRIPQIEASIAHATPLKRELIPEAALCEALSITPPPLLIRVIIALDCNKSHNPIITPAIVPANPQ